MNAKLKRPLMRRATMDNMQKIAVALRLAIDNRVNGQKNIILTDKEFDQLEDYEHFISKIEEEKWLVQKELLLKGEQQ